MNPKNQQKKNNSICGCCSKSAEEFNSDEIIFEYFGKEFSEYEYVIENLAIRPAPKKLLDLVPVHSTNISKNSIYRIPCIENTGEPNHRTSPKMSHRPKLSQKDHGDFDETPTLNILPENHKSRCGPCNPLSKNYNPCSKYPYDRKPCGSCKTQLFPHKCESMDFDTAREVVDLRKNIRKKEYRTTKQILADLCEASEQSLPVKSKNVKEKAIPTEIKEAIDTLRVKKPMPQFYTRTEKRIFNTGVYFANVKKNSSEDNTRNEESPNANNQGTKTPLVENDVQYNESQPSFTPIKPNRTSVDSTAQTEVSKECPCPKKKNLKWKIIINKHSNCKC